MNFATIQVPIFSTARGEHRMHAATSLSDHAVDHHV